MYFGEKQEWTDWDGEIEVDTGDTEELLGIERLWRREEAKAELSEKARITKRSVVICSFIAFGMAKKD